MHALSIGTWIIHNSTLIEWMLAIILIVRWANQTNNKAFVWLALAMLPNLASAMAAITWHIFDNSPDLKGLVVLQAGMTMLGNSLMAVATWNLLRREKTQNEPS